MSEKQNKNVTVRVQKIKKNHIKQKLVFFLILAIGLVILAVFSEHLCPYDCINDNPEKNRYSRLSPSLCSDRHAPDPFQT